MTRPQLPLPPMISRPMIRPAGSRARSVHFTLDADGLIMIIKRRGEGLPDDEQTSRHRDQDRL